MADIKVEHWRITVRINDGDGGVVTAKISELAVEKERIYFIYNANILLLRFVDIHLSNTTETTIFTITDKKCAQYISQ